MIELRLLGPASLRDQDGNELHSVLARPKLVGLLAVLALSPKSGYLRRDTLLGLFWADAEQERARASLRQALYNLRQSLGRNALESRGEEEIRLNPEEVRVDAATCRAALSEGDLVAGLELYRGDLLEGFFLPGAPGFDMWLERERGSLRAMAASGAWALAEESASQGNPGGSGHWTRRALGLAPFDEPFLRKGMRLLARVGDRAGAIQVHAAFAGRMWQELEMEPSEETEALAREIAEGWVAEADGADPGSQKPFPGPTASTGEDSEAASDPEGAGDSGIEPHPPPVTLWRRALGVATVLVAVGVLAVAWSSRDQEPAATSLADRTSPQIGADSLPSTVLAVLPFQAHGRDQRTEEMAAGVHEEILTYLSKVPGLTVISRRSVEQYAQTDLTLQEIALRLGSGSVLEGSIQEENDQIRVSVQLIDAASDTHLWAQTFYRESRDLLELQLEIALRVAGALRAELVASAQDPTTRDSLEEALSADLLREALASRGRRPPPAPDSGGEGRP